MFAEFLFQIHLLEGSSIFVRVADARRDDELASDISHNKLVSNTHYVSKSWNVVVNVIVFTIIKYVNIEVGVWFVNIEMRVWFTNIVWGVV